MSLETMIMKSLNKLVGNAPPRNSASEFAVNQAPFQGPAGDTAAAIEASTPRHARKESPMDNPRIVRPKPDLLANIPWPSPAQTVIFNERLRDAAYYDGPPDSLRTALAELDTQWLRIQDAIAEASRNQRPAYMQHREDLANRVAAGGPPDAKDAWTPQDFDEDAFERKSAFKAKAKELERQAWTLAEPELLKKAEAVNQLADEVEAQERERAASWGFNCVGPWVMALRKFAVSLSDGSRACVGKPSAMIETL